MTALDAAIAITRFGLGSRPGEIESIAGDPAGWLVAQIGEAPMPEGLTGSKEGLIAFDTQFRPRMRELRERGGARADQLRAELRESQQSKFLDQLRRRTALALTTRRGFAERWVRFWSNHFTVSAGSLLMEVLAPAHEAEAIRPHAFSSFSTLLLAAQTHPAMLVYLDNVSSAGPNSPAGRERELGLNENLARETLELHTLGVEGGYGQADVEALAAILTGWTVRRGGAEARPGEAVFEAYRHEPGAQRLLGTTYDQADAAQARAALEDLARHPATVRRLSTKLARHFFADDPDPRDVDHIERAWIRFDGDLSEVARAVVTAPGAFAPQPEKFKTPEEYLISTLRALDIAEIGAESLERTLTMLGQVPFRAPSPQGWPDEAAAWTGPDALLKRLEFAHALSQRRGTDRQPDVLVRAVLGERLGAEAERTIALAASREQGLTLLLMAPDFLRR